MSINQSSQALGDRANHITINSGGNSGGAGSGSNYKRIVNIYSVNNYKGKQRKSENRDNSRLNINNIANGYTYEDPRRRDDGGI